MVMGSRITGVIAGIFSQGRLQIFFTDKSMVIVKLPRLGYFGFRAYADAVRDKGGAVLPEELESWSPEDHQSMIQKLDEIAAEEVPLEKLEHAEILPPKHGFFLLRSGRLTLTYAGGRRFEAKIDANKSRKNTAQRLAQLLEHQMPGRVTVLER